MDVVWHDHVGVQSVLPQDISMASAIMSAIAGWRRWTLPAVAASSNRSMAKNAWPEVIAAGGNALFGGRLSCRRQVMKTG